MTTITLEMEQFTQSLQDAMNRSMGYVTLQPETTQGSEGSPPPYTPSVPSVMGSFALVPSDKYRFNYNGVRAAKFVYFLSRNALYEIGEFIVIHNLQATSSVGNEPTPPSEPLPFTPPNFYVQRNVILQTGGALGVDFTFQDSPVSAGSQPEYALSFKITNALPAVWPTLNMSYVTAFEMEF